MEMEELIRKHRAITLEEGNESKVVIGNVMKEKGRKIVDGCLLGRVCIQEELAEKVSSLHYSKYGEQ